MVERLLCMQEALGLNPSTSIFYTPALFLTSVHTTFCEVEREQGERIEIKVVVILLVAKRL